MNYNYSLKNNFGKKMHSTMVFHFVASFETDCSNLNYGVLRNKCLLIKTDESSCEFASKVFCRTDKYPHKQTS